MGICSKFLHQRSSDFLLALPAPNLPPCPTAAFRLCTCTVTPRWRAPPRPPHTPRHIINSQLHSHSLHSLPPPNESSWRCGITEATATGALNKELLHATNNLNMNLMRSNESVRVSFPPLSGKLIKQYCERFGKGARPQTRPPNGPASQRLN